MRNISIMFATLQNQRVLHCEKEKKKMHFVSVMHTSDVPKVHMACNRVLSQDWIARVP